MKRATLLLLILAVLSAPIFSKSARKVYRPKAKAKPAASKVVKNATPKAAPKAEPIYEAKITAAAGDAYVTKKAADGSVWAIGTKGIEAEYRVKNGKFYLTSLVNKKAGKSYVTSAAPVDLFRNITGNGLAYKFDTFARLVNREHNRRRACRVAYFLPDFARRLSDCGPYAPRFRCYLRTDGARGNG